MPRQISKPAERTGQLMDEWRRERPGEDLSLQSVRTKLLLLGTHIARDNDRAARELGAGGPELTVLFALRRSGPPYRMRPADLLDALLVPSSSMTRQLDSLLARGLVRRSPDPQDGRVSLVELTAAGVAFADRALGVILQESPVSIGLASMQPSQVERLDALLRKLLEALPGN